MAQHISILKNDFHPKIKETIIKRFSKKNIGLASLKYQEIKDKDLKINNSDRVFINNRKIKGKQEIFEIHFNSEKNKVEEIFWVK
ncbi:hypothetical protein [Winogradskyella jejuensis]|uniref:Uncharacterized protein n=1 Tax=Winogradskyella jejuensis TaxID=1089305 RepID=A0A1M5NDZ3_9FLAO|nr:hypothetical protein [Winogradskyella jejuensis]SHG87203.1 hypothetical protein SAMN05444148_1158 [Winogradskyella jejuensis]